MNGKNYNRQARENAENENLNEAVIFNRLRYFKMAEITDAEKRERKEVVVEYCEIWNVQFSELNIELRNGHFLFWRV